MVIDCEEKNSLGEIIHALKSEEKEIVFMKYPNSYGPPGSTPQYALLEIELLIEIQEFCPFRPGSGRGGTLSESVRSPLLPTVSS
jgi:hypothetical protein